MNFLSHFYFDKHTTQPEYGLGLLLPDLVHQHNKTWIIKPERKFSIFEEDVLPFYWGWKRHKDIDRLFHNSPYFLQKSGILKEKIHSSFSKSQVWSFFLAHITLELTLDSLLITENQIQVSALYSLLDQVNRKSLIKFLTINNVQEPESFLPFYDEFLSSGYLDRYSNPAELVYPLGRICYRIWKEKFTLDQNEVLQKTILNFCSENKEDFMSVFYYIKENLPTTPPDSDG